jgi:rod shape-determining protein MreD
MKLARSFALLTLLAFAAAIEVTWLNPIGLPGATPPLVLVLVLSAAMRRSPNRAALVGFVAGIVVDVMPPSVTPLGVSAFAFAITAYAVSQFRDILSGSVGLPLLISALAGFFVPIVRYVHLALIGTEYTLVDPIFIFILTSALYSVMLATIVFPALAWLESKFATRNSQIFR